MYFEVRIIRNAWTCSIRTCIRRGLCLSVCTWTTPSLYLSAELLHGSVVLHTTNVHTLFTVIRQGGYVTGPDRVSLLRTKLLYKFVVRRWRFNVCTHNLNSTAVSSNLPRYAEYEHTFAARFVCGGLPPRTGFLAASPGSQTSSALCLNKIYHAYISR